MPSPSSDGPSTSTATSHPTPQVKVIPSASLDGAPTSFIRAQPPTPSGVGTSQAPAPAGSVQLAGVVGHTFPSPSVSSASLASETAPTSVLHVPQSSPKPRKSPRPYVAPPSGSKPANLYKWFQTLPASYHYSGGDAGPYIWNVTTKEGVTYSFIGYNKGDNTFTSEGARLCIRAPETDEFFELSIDKEAGKPPPKPFHAQFLLFPPPSPDSD